ncbi:transcriptional regulator ATRX protein [Salix suchowensis]|nr:transcriptional regulator ATRX protein [Salix suchowensis]
MKLLPSPSISSSSSSSLDPNMCTSKSATASCLTGLLRRILCSRSLPTHPSDQITETARCFKLETTAATPGVVARLMGLESFPETSSVDVKVGANSISRSRSMNSMEFRGENDQIQGQHRRVRSTLSFRERPTFLEVENKEYFVLSFENIGGESKKVRSKERKCEVGSGELKEKRREKSKRKENRREKVVESEKRGSKEKIKKMVLRDLNEPELSNRILEDHSPDQEVDMDSEDFSLENKWLYHEEVSGMGAGLRKTNKKTKAEFSSQDSSPVSVLDFDQFIDDPEVTKSEEDTKSGESNSRRKLSPRLENQDQEHLSRRSDGNLIFNDRNSNKTEEPCPGSRKKVCHNHDYSNMWDEVCKLTETQVVETNLNARKNMCKFEEDLEEISAEFGLQILDQLLQELVDQLA